MTMIEELQATCDVFNTLAPVGTKIRVCKGNVRRDPWHDTVIAEPGAYVLGGHTAVVKVPGDSIALSHVEIIKID